MLTFKFLFSLQTLLFKNFRPISQLMGVHMFNLVIPQTPETYCVQSRAYHLHPTSVFIHSLCFCTPCLGVNSYKLKTENYSP